ncbi:MAG TPA: type II toxin-antitoxin system Phd/YefM family antitoxin [Anaerolineae bacterium]|nr:type II toxin-antitoxin system Phd/YefM family antitoxin [Anaerolineae bacterium]
MNKEMSIADARNHFTAVVRDVETDTPITLTRRGKPVAVILSMAEYERLQTNTIGFWQAFSAFNQEINLAGLHITPDIFTDVRDNTAGRDFSW